MRISESTLRRIIREEAQRALQEQENSGPAGVAAPVRTVLWNILATAGFHGTYTKVAGLIDKLSGLPMLADKIRPLLTNRTPAAAHFVIVGLRNAFDQDWNTIKFDGKSAKKFTDIAEQFASDRGQGGTPITNPAAAYTAYKENVGAKGTEFMTSLGEHFASFPAPQATQPSVTADAEYTVKQGDTISAILATYYNVRPSSKNMSLYSEFARMNGIADPNVIEPGQKLKLPDQLNLRSFKLTKRAASK